MGDFAEMVAFVEQAEAEERKEDGAASQEGENTLLLHYQELVEQNSDLVGWISIEGTTVNYSVMHTLDGPKAQL